MKKQQSKFKSLARLSIFCSSLLFYGILISGNIIGSSCDSGSGCTATSTPPTTGDDKCGNCPSTCYPATLTRPADGSGGTGPGGCLLFSYKLGGAVGPNGKIISIHNTNDFDITLVGNNGATVHLDGILVHNGKTTTTVADITTLFPSTTLPVDIHACGFPSLGGGTVALCYQ